MQTIRGQILSVTYADPDTGFTVAQMEPELGGTPLTVVGPIHDPSPGEFLELDGEWSDHPRFGRQFNVTAYRYRVPVTREAIRRYLGSGLIKGIGSEMARRIVDRFGEETLSVIDREVERLTEVSGIGGKRVAMIHQAWREHRHLRDAMLFLQSHGIRTGQVLRIFRRFGDQTITAVKSNPYRLADEVRGIGFVTADRIAAQLNVPRTSPLRIESGVLHALDRWTEAGHTCCTAGTLVQKAGQLLEVPSDLVEKAVESLVSRGRMVKVPQPGHAGDAALERVYPAGLFRQESAIGAAVLRLLKGSPAFPPIDPEAALDWVEKRLGIELAAAQRQAVRLAVKAKVIVITGGPGTGKTTIINALLKIASAKNIEFRLAAPTGRAAKRMTDATGEPAGTLHRLLEFNPRTGAFHRDAAHPLSSRLLIVDEASMMDTMLAASFLEAVPSEATLVLVGDIHQLPSVGPGNVLSDLIASGAVPVVELTEIFRQARESRIVVYAHQINAGIMPVFDSGARKSDCYFIHRADPDAAVELIIQLVARRIPDRLGFDPLRDIQVLTPMNRGSAGTINLNRRLQEALNPVGPEAGAGPAPFRVADKVMQVRNNYVKEVFNGDIGSVAEVDLQRKEIRVDFDDRRVVYDAAEFDDLTLAYAISIHKSQGSEFPAVVFPVLTQHYMLLQRNLLYTAITRGKRLAVMVGTPKALSMGIHNAQGIRRQTGLRDLLASAMAAGTRPE